MPSEKLQLWYCDTFVNTPWQFFFLLLPLAGAYFYGQDKKKLAWILIGVWVAMQVILSFLNNLVFNCSME
jgi:hypothetical protein